MSITIARDENELLAEINLSPFALYGYKRYEPIIESRGFKIISSPIINNQEKYNLGYKKGNGTLNLGIITFYSSDTKSILKNAFSDYDFILTKIDSTGNEPNLMQSKRNANIIPNNDKKNEDKNKVIPLDENEEPIPEINKKIIEKAKIFIGSYSWSPLAIKKSEDGKSTFYPKEFKCNLFVYDVLYLSGISLDLPNESGKLGQFFGQSQRPYRCKEWYNEEVPNFKCIGKGIEALNKSLPGDIITDGKHMGFISGYRKTISASSKVEDLKVVENDWGWREDQKDIVKIFRHMPFSEDGK